MTEEKHSETSGRDNEDLENLQMFIPSIQNHLAHGYTPEECRQLLRVSDEQFESLLAAVSAVGENRTRNYQKTAFCWSRQGNTMAA
jgi:hypothetical protein